MMMQLSNNPLWGFLWSWELYLLIWFLMSFFWVNFSWPRLTEFSSSDFLNRIEQNILPFKQTHTHQLYFSSLLFPFLVLVIEILPRRCFVYDATECASLPASEHCWRHTTGRDESQPQPSGKPQVRSLAAVLKNARFSSRRDGRSVIFFSQFRMLFPQGVSPSAFLPLSTFHSIPTQLIERSLLCPSFSSSVTLQYWRILSTPIEVQGRTCQQKVSSMAVQCPWCVWTTAASPREYFLEDPYHLQQSPNIGHRPFMVLSRAQHL